MTQIRSLTILLLPVLGTLLSLTTLAGCGGRRSVPGRPKTVPVKVTVIYRGAPVAEANIQFLPDGTGNAATGITDKQGIARLTTFEQNDGVVPGTYRVTIRKSIQVGGSNSDDPDAPPVRVTYREELPAKYAAPETSGLSAQVSESQTEFTFELSD
ncbi:MAG: carboxypeptidase-like regulatory domain-containing protein [Thermogutta sp.]